MEQINPIANRGTIVTDPERFIGRKKELALIRRRVVESPNPSNLAIIAEKGLGGSSLAYQAFFVQKEELREKRIAAAWIDAKSIDLPVTQIAKELYTEAKRLDLPEIAEGFENFIRHIYKQSLDDLFDGLKKLLSALAGHKIKTICVLDEFEQINHLSDTDILFFGFIQNVIRNPDYQVCVVVVSRRPIKDFGKQAGGFSLEFSQGFDRAYDLDVEEIFEDVIYLKPFNEEDLNEYYEQLSEAPLKADHIDRIDHYCGGWPFLMNVLCHEVFEGFREEHKMDIDAAYQIRKDRFLSHYHRLLRLLRKENRLETLWQIISNSAGNGKKDEFLRSGIIKSKKDHEGYKAYSEHFEEYLSLVSRGGTENFLKSCDELENILSDLVLWMSGKRDNHTLESLSIDPKLSDLSLHLGVSKEELLKRIQETLRIKEEIEKTEKEPTKQVNHEEIQASRKHCEELAEKAKKIYKAKDKILIKRAGDDGAGLPTAIKKLAIRNYHDIKEIDLDLSREAQWIFLTGENGHGKTLLLQAIVIALNGKKAEWGGGNLAPKGFNAGVELVEDGVPRLYNLGNPYPTSFKTFAAYGPSRLQVRRLDPSWRAIRQFQDNSENEDQISVTEDEEQNSRTYSLFRYDGKPLNIEDYMILLHKVSNEEENPKREKAEKLLEITKKVLLKLLEPHIIKIDTGGVEVSYIETNGKGIRNLNIIASGLMSIIAMSGDILIRLMEENQDMEEPKDLKGIVIIDELDLHLHPKWQKKMPGQLSKVFPNVQFITATHSPIPMLGAPKNSIFLKVTRNEQGHIKAERLDIHDIRRLHPNLLLSSPIFDMEKIFHLEKESVDLVKTEDSWKEMLKNEEVKKSVTEKFRKRMEMFQKGS